MDTNATATQPLEKNGAGDGNLATPRPLPFVVSLNKIGSAKYAAEALPTCLALPVLFKGTM